jgi:hypothetical protein
VTHPNTWYPSATAWRALHLAGVLVLGSVAVATAATWNNPAGGVWSDAANWTPADVPDAAGESAVLPALGGAYQVTLDLSPTLDAIQVDAADVTLDVNGFSINGAKVVNNSGTIRNFAGVYNSNKLRNLAGGTVRVAPGGTIEVGATDLWNAGTIVAAREIHWAGCVQLWGGGTLALNDTRLLDPNVDQDVTDQYNRGMSIASGTTLRGTGVIYKQQIFNAGLIQADVAQLSPSAPEQVLWFNGTMMNMATGTIRLMNGGHINVNRPALDNKGLITSGPGGGSLRLEMPYKMFGTLGPSLNGFAPAPGFIRTDGGDLEIGVNAMHATTIQRGPGGGVVKMAHVYTRGVTVDAGAELHFAPRVVYGARDPEGNILADDPVMDIGRIAGMIETVIINNGTIRFTRGLLRNSGSLEPQAQTIIRGSGELILEGATIGAGSGSVFVNGAGHTIRGCGVINAPFLNEGTVALDCSGGQSARIGGRPVPAAWTPEGKTAIPGTAIENRGRISIARGVLSISGPEAARYPLEVAAPTVFTNKGTISVAGGSITLEKSVTLNNSKSGVLSAEGGTFLLGGTSGATVIGGRLDAGRDANARKADMLRGERAFASFLVQKAVTLRDVTLGSAATLLTAPGAVTMLEGASFVNLGTNRVQGTLVVSSGTRYIEPTGAALVVDGGSVSGMSSKPIAAPTLASSASTPAMLRFYVRSESQGARFVLELPQAAQLDGRVYDAAGREVARIADGTREAGVYSFALGRAGGAGLPNGIYFGRMLVTREGMREVLQARIAVVR